jgi:hypothetical protein
MKQFNKETTKPSKTKGHGKRHTLLIPSEIIGITEPVERQCCQQQERQGQLLVLVQLLELELQLQGLPETQERHLHGKK